MNPVDDVALNLPVISDCEVLISRIITILSRTQWTWERSKNGSRTASMQQLLHAFMTSNKCSRTVSLTTVHMRFDSFDLISKLLGRVQDG